ncbi:MAG: hypothetical protein EZS28_043313 [Streblomastix strix]|uniref:Uncharacterized protein n=1 Tax=Streblomastix strix TaxID=222440 RepID=A0A5J4TUC9_9EUKA|nr:MAG: hypothetical protein EZS28_043313 [Streblomastix strix]
MIDPLYLASLLFQTSLTSSIFPKVDAQSYCYYYSLVLAPNSTYIGNQFVLSFTCIFVEPDSIFIGEYIQHSASFGNVFTVYTGFRWVLGQIKLDSDHLGIQLDFPQIINLILRLITKLMSVLLLIRFVFATVGVPIVSLTSILTYSDNPSSLSLFLGFSSLNIADTSDWVEDSVHFFFVLMELHSSIIIRYWVILIAVGIQLVEKFIPQVLPHFGHIPCPLYPATYQSSQI